MLIDMFCVCVCVCLNWLFFQGNRGLSLLTALSVAVLQNLVINDIINKNSASSLPLIPLNDSHLSA